jgi:WD40 repeat protein
MWDLRSLNSGALLAWETKYSGFSIDFSSPNKSNYLITGSKDNSVYKYDIRKAGDARFTNFDENYESKYSCHNTLNVRVVHFHPSKKGIFASGGDDGKVFIYDENINHENQILGQIDPNLNVSENKNEENYKFEHDRHIGKIMDFQWHPTRQCTIASVDNEKDFQVWSVNGDK